MRRAGRLVALAALFAASPLAAEDQPWPAGLYSNVRMSKQTGDLGGMEARFYEDGVQHMVEFVWCEGWCNETFSVPVTRVPEGGFTFSYFQRFSDGSVEEGQTMRFVAWLEGKAMRISAWQGEEELNYEGQPQRLKPVKVPFGITVAHSNDPASGD
jgi:hypothetical protein